MGADMKIIDEIIRKVRNLNDDQQKEILETLKIYQAGKEREYNRLKTKTEIDVVVGDRVIQTNSGDLSAGGVYINTKGNFELNISARVVFSIPGIDTPFKLKGNIVRVDENGIAIKFDNATPYFKKFLDDAIHENMSSGGDI